MIASGGAGTLEHLYDGFVKGKADAVLAASIFHFRTIRFHWRKPICANTACASDFEPAETGGMTR